MESKFFTFVRPYLDYIDSGRFFRQPFCWLYSVLAVLNLLFPLIVLAQSCRLGVFHAGGKVVIAFIIAFLVLALGGWISFQIWWNRKNRIMQSSKQGDDFIAIPVFSDFIQTAGEWAGTWIAVVGGLLSLLLSLILGDDMFLMNRALGFGFLDFGFMGIVLFPIYGFLIVIVARVVAEVYRALAAIANNTKKS